MLRWLLAKFEERCRRRYAGFLEAVTKSVGCKPVHCVAVTDQMDYPYDDYSWCRCPSHTANPRGDE